MHRRIVAIVIAVLLGLTTLGTAVAAPPTTLVRTIADRDGDFRLEYAAGDDYEVLGDAPEGFIPPHDGSILNFLQMSDFQMIDEESPGRVEFLDRTLPQFSSAYRPQDSLTTQITEAMVRQVRNTRSPITQEELDLTILTGDNADSQQFNETRWFIDILDGGQTVDPNSGVEGTCLDTPDDSIYDGVRGGGKPFGYYEPDGSGPEDDGNGYSPNPGENGGYGSVRDFPGLLEAANTPFQTIGLDMPWYSAFGNHDALIQGNSPDAYAGPGGAAGEGIEIARQEFQGIATGCAKFFIPPSFFPTNPGELGAFLTNPGAYLASHPSFAAPVPLDLRRCYLSKDEHTGPPPPGPCAGSSWIGEHFETTGTPVGHGFANRPPPAVTNHDGYYSFTPATGVRFVVLDTVTDECGPVPVCSEGSVDNTQFEWLRSEILDADAEGQYVMVFSHHTLKTIRLPNPDPSEQPVHYGQRVDPENPANPQNPSGAETLEDLYCDNSNVLAHIAGHEHENYTIHYDCDGDDVGTLPDGSPVTSAAGPGDFWHVSTAAHADWPQQARMIELIDNGDASMTLALTLIDHAGPPNPGNAPAPLDGRGAVGEQVLKLASIGRELAYNDFQGSRGARGDKESDRNVLIYIDRPYPYPTD
nr:hypothetical protein [Actinomycetota bacterium]